jgi:hypothetical protein
MPKKWARSSVAEVVQALGNVRVIGRQELAADGERPLVSLARRRQVAGLLVENPQVVQGAAPPVT